MGGSGVSVSVRSRNIKLFCPKTDMACPVIENIGRPALNVQVCFWFENNLHSITFELLTFCGSNNIIQATIFERR